MVSFITSEQENWTTADWDKAYSNTGSVANTAEIVAAWDVEAPAFRRSRTLMTEDATYGAGEREKIDMFLPERSPPKGLMFFIHGGYWLRFDKSSFSHFAEGALARGYAVAMPSYDLKPHVDMSHICAQLENSLIKAVEHVGGPIHVCGHSAGGHLAAMLIRKETGLSQMVKDRLKRVMGISGVYDLEPLTKTTMNNDFQFTSQEVETQSPLRLEKMTGPEFISWVGADELPEFVRHSEEQAKAWDVEYVAAIDKNHFTVIDDLRNPNSSMLNKLFA